MDARVRKLVVLGLEEEDAEALVKIGLDTPRRIKAGDVQKVKGIGKAKEKKIRERFPKVK